MNQIALVIDTFEKYPLLLLAIVILFVIVSGGMYRLLLAPKLKDIKTIANSNTDHIEGIKKELIDSHNELKDDLSVKHYELKSDMKEFFHSMSTQSEKVVQALVGGVSDQIKAMNCANDNQHNELFAKIDELSIGYNSNEKRITLLESKRK